MVWLIISLAAKSFNNPASKRYGEMMENEKEAISGSKSVYFDLQAEFGSTNHMGGLKATKELIEMCHITADSYVLDVGCCIGITASYMAKEYGCHVVGADISEKMIERSREKAKREGVEKRIEFTVADVHTLPFKDNLFDAVICESVTAFAEDKKRAVAEYVRVTKPGRLVGLNETTWIQPPPAELVDYIFRTTGASPEPSDSWEDLLRGSGLSDVVVRPCTVTALDQFVNETKMAGLDAFKAWGRVLSLYVKSPVYRKALKDMAREAWSRPKNMFRYFGYGLYVGRNTYTQAGKNRVIA